VGKRINADCRMQNAEYKLQIANLKMIIEQNKPNKQDKLNKPDYYDDC
jgi:hypothetical protein